MYEIERETAIRLAIQAGELALAIAARGFAVEEKSPNDLVTEADRALNALLVKGFEAAFPADAVVAEESIDNRRRERRTWFVDPIDGTADYVKRNGEWAVMIGLVVDGAPVLGVVNQAEAGALFWAVAGEGAFVVRGGETSRISTGPRSLAQELVLVESRSHPDAFSKRLCESLQTSSRYPHGSLGLKLAQISEGRADYYANGSGRCHLWDLAAGEVILNEAGGAIRTPEDARIDYLIAETLVRPTFVCASTAAWPAVRAAMPR